tara:strand:- start:9228 stop:10142 length:915 start_codon:yes stop_codon:yes gene_type:complete
MGIEAMRNFFHSHGFKEILTPPAVENPGMETHIHPFQLYQCKQSKLSQLYLHTSPEFEMKQVLAQVRELSKIYTISYCFRDEPHSPHHRNQFLMLEWYRRDANYFAIMDDIENLVNSLKTQFDKDTIKFERRTIQDIVQEYANFDILAFEDASELKNKISKDLKSVPLPSQDCEYDDYFFLIFLNLIEPHLKNHPYLILSEYPAPLAALSTIKENDPRVCERFECYIKGIEIANCFNESTDLIEITNRFKQQAKFKKETYGYELSAPEQFFQMMERGYPNSAGVALGVERLMGTLFNLENPFYR